MLGTYNYAQNYASIFYSGLLLSQCGAEVFHVTPTLPATQSCPPPCHTLDQYAQNTSLFAGDTNISLIFLKGVHNLSSDLTISLANWNDSLLEFQGQGKVPKDTMITLLLSISIDLSDITHLHLVNINVQQHRQLYYTKPTINISNI